MIQGLDNPKHKERIAIVAIGYNRQAGLARLLNSVNDAVYDIQDVPLFISIDASGDQKLYEYVKGFDWKHGPKFVNIQEERLGLKNHIFQCMSLCKYFKGVIILEDDLFVSPYFYHYACQTLDKYGDDESVAGIAFYKNEYDGFSGVPYQPLSYGQDVFAWKSVCSWGEMVNERMWNQFSSWLSSWDEQFSSIDMSEIIKGWSRAWSKYFYAYLVANNKYFIFPFESLTTNFNDAGGEHGGGEPIVQVALQQGKRNYQLAGIDQLAHYDIYGNNEDVAKWLGLATSELTVDFFINSRYYTGRYVLTNNNLPYERIKGFALSLRPWELNVKYDIQGDDLILYDRKTSSPVVAPRRKYTRSVLDYFFARYSSHFSFRYVARTYLDRIKKKIMK